MKSIRLYVEGQLVDYIQDDDFNVALKFAAEDLSNPEDRKFPRSYSFNLPKTVKNNLIFGNIDSRYVIKKFNKKYNANLSINTTTILQGILLIKEIDVESYKCELQSTVLNFIDNISNKKLKDIKSFNKQAFFFEQTISQHINAAYNNDSEITQFKTINSTNWRRLTPTAQNWSFVNSVASITIANLQYTPLFTAFTASANVKYTFEINISTTAKSGVRVGLGIGYYTATTIASDVTRNVQSVSTSVTGNQTITVQLKPTLNTDTFIIYVSSANIGNIVTINSVKLIDPIETCDWQYPFIMYERYYTNKALIDYIKSANLLDLYTSFTGSSTDSLIENELTKNLVMINGVTNSVGPVVYRNFRNYWEFPPAPYLTKILKYLCNEAGFELSGSWIQKDEIKKLIIPYTGDASVWQFNSGIISKFDLELAQLDEIEVSNTNNQRINSNGNATLFSSWTTLKFDDELSDPNNNYSDLTNQYTFPKDYTTRVEARINLRQPLGSFNGVITSLIQVVVDRNGTIEVIDEERNFGITTQTLILNTSTFNFLTGDKLFVRARCYSTDSILKTTEFGSAQTDVNSPIFIDPSSTLKVIMNSSNDQQTYLNVAAFLPDMEQREFLKEVINLFNLQVFFVDNTIYLEEYNSTYLPNTYAINLDSKAIDNQQLESFIPDEESTMSFVYDLNETDDVGYLPTSLYWPIDFNKLTRLKKKELNVNDKLYPGNSIFNKLDGQKVINSKFTTTNYRRVSFSSPGRFNEAANATVLSFYNLTIPVISTKEDLKKDWFILDGDQNDNKNFTDTNYGSGLHLLKYEGNSSQSLHPNKDFWWVFLGNETLKTRLGLTTAINADIKFVDVNGYTYYDLKNQVGFTNRDNLDLNYNGDGAIIKSGIQDNAYDRYYSKRYKNLPDSNYLTKNFYINETDYINIVKNRVVSYQGQVYSLVQIDYEPLQGQAKLKLLKRIN